MRIRAAVPLVVVSGLIVGVPPASAAPGWVTPVSNLSSAGSSPGTIKFASNARGDVAVAWLDPATQQVFESDRAAGGTFNPGAAVSTASGQALGSLALDNTGVVYVFFGTDQPTPSASLPQVAARQVGTSAWSVTPLASASMADPPLTAIGAVTPSGRAIAVWEQGHTAGNEFSKYEFATKAAGSTTWSSKLDITGAGGGGNVALVPSSPALAIDSSGDAAFVYTRFDNGFSRHIAWGQTLTAGQTTWTTPSKMSTDVAGDSVESQPVVAMDATGTATAAWTRTNPTHNVAQFATKTLAAAAWPTAPSSGPNDLTASTDDAGQPSIAVEPDGTTTIAWQRNAANEQRTRAAGGASFVAAAGIPTTLTSPGAPTLVAGPNGGVVASWTGTSGGLSVIGAATRASGAATFSALPNLPGTNNGSALAGLDDQGNVPAAWLNSTGGNTTVQASAFEAGAPTISNVTFPATGVSGTPFSYSATVSDRWSPITSSWTFGDGATGPLSGTHTYAAAGSFLATLTATNGVGNSTQSTKTIQVSNPPPPPPPSGPTASPAITSLKLSPATFKAASSGGSIAAAKTGTTITYKVSQPSTTTFTVLQPARGVKKGKLCVAPPKHKPKGKKLKSCQRFLSKGSFTHTDKTGPVSFRFTGRTRGHKLAPGSYGLQAIGSNAKGKGRAVATGFKIVKR